MNLYISIDQGGQWIALDGDEESSGGPLSGPPPSLLAGLAAVAEQHDAAGTGPVLLDVSLWHGDTTVWRATAPKADQPHGLASARRHRNELADRSAAFGLAREWLRVQELKPEYVAVIIISDGRRADGGPTREPVFATGGQADDQPTTRRDDERSGGPEVEQGPMSPDQIARRHEAERKRKATERRREAERKRKGAAIRDELRHAVAEANGTTYSPPPPTGPDA